MVFSSIGFIYIFLPTVLLLHAILPKRFRNGILLLFSLAFYYVGEQRLLLVMIGCTVLSFFCARLMDRYKSRTALKRGLLIFAAAISLGTLAYYKYADLMLSSISLLTGADLPLLELALPIGISFYTFQTLGYIIDVYRGEVAPSDSLIDFMTYVTMFPQLIAGPIVRYQSVEGALKERSVTLAGYADGIKRFCFGLAKKVLLADTLAELVAEYNGMEEPTLLAAWLAIIAFTFQLYFDFSGYSDMAVGLGKMLGFAFPENFDDPLFSRSATEFWRRWHITLGNCFRDYLYIPLGGNRRGKARQLFNMSVVWLVTGLWHGAGYNFLLWGLYYGILIALEKLFFLKWLERSRILSRVYFILITAVGFVIFRTESLSQIPGRLAELFGLGGGGLADAESKYLLSSFFITLALALLLSLPIKRALGKVTARFKNGATLVKCAGYAWSLLLLVLSTAYLVDGSFSPFLYFRF